MERSAHDSYFRACLWSTDDQRRATRAAARVYDRPWIDGLTRTSIMRIEEPPVESHDVQWDPRFTARHRISDHSCTLTRTDSDSLRYPWATGRLLAGSFGVVSWLVRVDCSEGNRGFICIGVCDATARYSWGLALCSGQLERNSRDHNGNFVSVRPPDYFPDGDGEQILRDRYGQPTGLAGRAVGSVVKVIVDADAGTLGFSVNGGAPLIGLTGFPRGACLRPWALLGTAGDSVCIGGYSSSSPPGGPRPPTIEEVRGAVLLNGSCPALSDPTCRAPTYWALTSDDNYRRYE